MGHIHEDRGQLWKTQNQKTYGWLVIFLELLPTIMLQIRKIMLKVYL